MIERLKTLLMTAGFFIAAIIFAVIYLPAMFILFLIAGCLTPLDIPIWVITGKAPFCKVWNKLDRLK